MTQEHKSKVINQAESALSKIEQRIAASKSQESYGESEAARGAPWSTARANQNADLLIEIDIHIGADALLHVLMESACSACVGGCAALFPGPTLPARALVVAAICGGCAAVGTAAAAGAVWTVVDVVFLIVNLSVSEGTEISMP